MGRRRHSFWKRYLAGVAGGAAGTLAMGLYMKGIQSLKGGGEQSSGETPQQPKQHNVSLIGRRHEEGEPPTAAVARILYRTIARRDAPPETARKLGNVVHWTYGIKMGGAYGLIHRRGRKLDVLGGAAYGVALWALGDEVALPLLGLAEGPKAYPKSLHAEMFGAHIVYGVTTAAVSHLVERAL
ncbi:MAG TPA: DUF1440 domain-containing protein [Bryobacteraceae bacterium]|nr:DUF1440 domain-containing protein [Bryobacteraceae bacterium]